MIKLSATLQKFAEEKETVTNVHGVRENFLIVGDERAKAAALGEPFAAGNRCVCGGWVGGWVCMRAFCVALLRVGVCVCVGVCVGVCVDVVGGCVGAWVCAEVCVRGRVGRSRVVVGMVMGVFVCRRHAKL